MDNSWETLVSTSEEFQRAQKDFLEDPDHVSTLKWFLDLEITPEKDRALALDIIVNALPSEEVLEFLGELLSLVSESKLNIYDGMKLFERLNANLEPYVIQILTDNPSDVDRFQRLFNFLYMIGECTLLKKLISLYQNSDVCGVGKIANFYEGLLNE